MLDDNIQLLEQVINAEKVQFDDLTVLSDDQDEGSSLDSEEPAEDTYDLSRR